MSDFWSGRVRDAAPYVPGEQPRGRTFLKLNTNENPYPPSPKALEAVRAAAGEELRLYPDPECTGLRRAVARHAGVDPSQVFCGNGSDEVLSFAFQAFFDPAEPVAFADVTYSFYEVWARYLGLTAELIPLRADFSLPVERFVREPRGGVVLANPNAPTGRALELEEVESIVRAHPRHVVVVDEAYVDFGARSAAPLVEAYPNLLVVQTASKSRSLAGLRVGWAIGQEELIDGLRRVRDSVNSYTVDRLAAAGVSAALDDEPYFEKTRRSVMDTRERTWRRLLELGFTVPPSRANFLFAARPGVSGRALLDGLRARGILVRWFDRPRISDYLRLTVGTDADMDALLAALEELAD